MELLVVMEAGGAVVGRHHSHHALILAYHSPSEQGSGGELQSMADFLKSLHLISCYFWKFINKEKKKPDCDWNLSLQLPKDMHTFTK